MTTDNFILDVCCDMMKVLTQQQLGALRTTLTKKLVNKEIKHIETALMNISNLRDNEYYLNLYQAELYANGRSKKTIEQYIRSNRNVLETIGKSISDITKNDIVLYRAMRQSKNLSENSLLNDKRFQDVFFKWLFDNEYIHKNPCANIKDNIRPPYVKKNIIDNYELIKMKDSCKNTLERALIDFLSSTGVRVGELINLKLNDVNFTTGNVHIYATKTHRDRTVFLNADALKHLIDYRNSLDINRIDSDYLFLNRYYKKISESSVEDYIHRVAKRADIERVITVHSFRKTLASNLSAMGMEMNLISEILGHVSTATTSKYYCKVDKDYLRYEFYKYMK